MDKTLDNRFANFGFVAATLVVLLHVAITHPVVRELCGIAVPFFFFASGWFLASRCGDKGWWSQALKKRIHTLLIPFLCFNILCWIMSKGWIRGWSLENVLTPIGLTLHITEYNVLWFVRALMMLVLIAPLLVIVLRRKCLGIPLLAVSFVLMNVLTSDIWCYVFSLKGLFYFSAGIFCRVHDLHHKILGRFDILCAALGFSGFAISCIFYGGGGGYNLITYPLILLGVWHWVPNCKWPRELTSTSFAVYLLHPMIIKAVRLGGIGAWINHSLVATFFMWVVVTCIAIVIARLMSRFARPLAALLLGGRL